MKLLVKQPEEVYKRVDGTVYRQIFVVGDVHGQYDKLMEQLEEVEFDRENDLLVSVGDLIDRGPDSAKMLTLLTEPWFTCVRGNHEDLATSAIEELEENAVGLWLYNGGTWILDIMPGVERDKVIERLLSTADLPFVLEIECDTQKVVVAHAAYPDDHYKFGKKVDTFACTWDRDRYLEYQRGGGKATKGADLFIHGHNHTKEVEFYHNHIYIATGAYKKEEPLTLMKIQ
jgi:Calcineurin-like phosphoesterase.